MDADILNNAGHYQILKDDVRSVTFCRFGDVTVTQETVLLLAIAQHRKVFFADNLGENKQDLSDYVLRLREDEYAQRTAQTVIQTIEQGLVSKTDPYVDYRENGKIKGLHLIKPKVNEKTLEVTEQETWICDNLELAGRKEKTKRGILLSFPMAKPRGKHPVHGRHCSGRFWHRCRLENAQDARAENDTGIKLNAETYRAFSL